MKLINPTYARYSFFTLSDFYVYAVLGTQLFASSMPEYFGNLNKSFFTLFQIMTGESWSEAIARVTMKIHSYSWIYFISFIIIVSFVVLNIVIGVIVDSINEIKNARNMDKGIKN